MMPIRSATWSAVPVPDVPVEDSDAAIASVAVGIPTGEKPAPRLALRERPGARRALPASTLGAPIDAVVLFREKSTEPGEVC